MALDSVETPFGKVQEALGGSATFFSYSAQLLHAGPPGGDGRRGFPRGAPEAARAIAAWTCTGSRSRPGRTFRWTGAYGYDLNEAKTLDTQLNVFADFRPTLDDTQSRVPYLFLANIDPELQLEVLRQMRSRPRLVALDTMNFWIQGKRDALLRVLREVDLVTINDGEARQLAERAEPHQGRAADRGARPAHGGGQARRVRRALAGR